MDRIFRFHVTLTGLIAALLVTAGNELKVLAQSQSTAFSAALILVSLLVGILSTPFILKILTSFAPFRRILFGKSWIEGYWYNLNIEESPDGNAISDPAITEISFKSVDLGYETTGHRIREGVDIFTFSQYVVIVGKIICILMLLTQTLRLHFVISSHVGIFIDLPEVALLILMMEW